MLNYVSLRYTYAGGTSRDRRAYIVGFYREKQRKGHELFNWRRKFSQLKDLKTETLPTFRTNMVKQFPQWKRQIAVMS